MKTVKQALSAVFDHISECMAPIIPIVLAGGILKMVALFISNMGLPSRPFLASV